MGIVEKSQELLIRNIEQLMDERRMEPKDLIKKSGLSSSGVYAIIKGDRWPAADNLDRVAKALNVSVQSLFRSDAPVAPSPTLEAALDIVKAQETRIKQLEAMLQEQRRAMPALPELERKVLAILAALQDDEDRARFLAVAETFKTDSHLFDEITERQKPPAHGK